ncbi:MAG: AAA family ATPase [bacterium]
MKKLIILNGACGVGKTTVARELEKSRKDVKVLFFDAWVHDGKKEENEKSLSGEDWQRVKTMDCVKMVKERYLNDVPVVLDIQSRPEFIKMACEENSITDYKVLLLDCSEAERLIRLQQRGQAELANEDMKNWAEYLRKESRNFGQEIINTSDMSVGEMIKNINSLL